MSCFYFSNSVSEISASSIFLISFNYHIFIALICFNSLSSMFSCFCWFGLCWCDIYIYFILQKLAIRLKSVIQLSKYYYQHYYSTCFNQNISSFLLCFLFRWFLCPFYFAFVVIDSTTFGTTMISLSWGNCNLSPAEKSLSSDIWSLRSTYLKVSVLDICPIGSFWGVTLKVLIEV